MAKIIQDISVCPASGGSKRILLLAGTTNHIGLYCKDSITGEPMSYCFCNFENSIGTMTDDNGLLPLQNDRGLTKLLWFLQLWLRNKRVNIGQGGKKTEALSILIRPTTIQIWEVAIKTD